MKPIVYIDILFFTNFVINYIILWSTAKISKVKASTVRLAVGAALGAVYAAVMFFPAFKIYYTVIAKLVFSLGLTAVTFNIESVRRFLKTFAVLYLVTFTFGGAALCIFYFTGIGAFISNGVLYFNLSWNILLLSTAIAYVVIKVSVMVVQKINAKDNFYIPISIMFDKKCASLNALLDTGNSLYDPISNFPVVVVEFQAIKDLLPESIQNIFLQSKENDLNLISSIMDSSVWLARFRLIPFCSLGSENGMLIGFKPDELKIVTETEKKDLKDIIIGIYNNKMTQDQKYSALLHPEIIQ